MRAPVIWALRAGLGIALLLALVWAVGGFDALRSWAEASQREVQNALARAVRAIRAGQPGAVLGLLGVAFAYGFFHAVGPGHGKFLIGGYGLARRVPLARLAVISVAASLAQATTAVVLVYAFVLALGWTREAVEGVADGVMLWASHGAVLLIGLWLVLRGFRGLRGQVTAQTAHHHHHDHDETCGCGHAHGPSITEVAAVTGPRDALALIAGVALRPCSGALFLLILTWQFGIAAAGIAGVYAMGLGTALVTVGVAALAVWTREGALAGLPGQGLARALPLIEVTAGVLIALIAGQLLWSAL